MKNVFENVFVKIAILSDPLNPKPHDSSSVIAGMANSTVGALDARVGSQNSPNI